MFTLLALIFPKNKNMQYVESINLYPLLSGRNLDLLVTWNILGE